MTLQISLIIGQYHVCTILNGISIISHNEETTMIAFIAFRIRILKLDLSNKSILILVRILTLDS